MKAKFLCDSVNKINDSQEDAKLSAVMSDENIENQDFNDATPSGNLEMMISNPKAMGYFKEGKEYYLDFTECN